MKSMNPCALTTIAFALSLALPGCAHRPPQLRPGRALRDVQPQVIAVDLAKGELGEVPAGFQVEQTGAGEPAAWAIVADPTAPGRGRVLAQTSADAVNKQRFPLCIYRGLSLSNVEATVRFKPISGKEDQSGGVIVRYQDKDNYYTLRANILEDNVRFYRYDKGKRYLVVGIAVRIAPGQWHTLSLLADGARFICTFDNQQFEAGDTTIGNPGRIGLWTKADAVTHFDQLVVKSYDLPASSTGHGNGEQRRK
jgi:hypothetical protein